MVDTEKLTKDLKDAVSEAHQAIDGMYDGGTCNLDSVFIPTGKTCQIKRKSQKVERAIEAAGAQAFHKSYGVRRGYIVLLGLGGQGATRTVAAETVCDSLRKRGWGDVSMWYQMD